ncbi:STAS domain-containing protein [Streptomyces sp. NPDC006283]|uniref:STAS domain-containing protein n=1 Tax=Streptomyces sp. NPDC006283 TaxID=3156741 RepID=UPI0033A67363
MSAHVVVLRGSRQAVVYVTGKLDVDTASRIRQALVEAIAGHERVIIDLRRLSFCDCAGLSALIAARNAARHHGTTLTFRNPPRQLARLLRRIPHAHTLPTTQWDTSGTPHTPEPGASAQF